MLKRAGVAVSADPVKANPTELLADVATIGALTSVAELESLPLSQEVTYVMKVSYNRGAQTLVCRLAVSIGEAECDLGMAVARDIWADAGLDVLGTSLIDGSGLEGNYITPENAVEIQSLMAKRPDAAGWRATLPILGVDGSLVDADLFNGRFRLGTKTLGGVMDTKDGRHLADRKSVV